MNKRKDNEQGDLDNAREITTVWTYFRDNQVEQLFKFLKIIEKEDNFIIVKILFCSHLF